MAQRSAASMLPAWATMTNAVADVPGDDLVEHGRDPEPERAQRFAIGRQPAVRVPHQEVVAAFAELLQGEPGVGDAAEAVLLQARIHGHLEARCGSHGTCGLLRPRRRAGVERVRPAGCDGPGSGGTLDLAEGRKRCVVIAGAGGIAGLRMAHQEQPDTGEVTHGAADDSKSSHPLSTRPLRQRGKVLQLLQIE